MNTVHSLFNLASSSLSISSITKEKNSEVAAALSNQLLEETNIYRRALSKELSPSFMENNLREIRNLSPPTFESVVRIYQSACSALISRNRSHLPKTTQIPDRIDLLFLDETAEKIQASKDQILCNFFECIANQRIEAREFLNSMDPPMSLLFEDRLPLKQRAINIRTWMNEHRNLFSGTFELPSDPKISIPKEIELFSGLTDFQKGAVLYRAAMHGHLDPIEVILNDPGVAHIDPQFFPASFEQSASKGHLSCIVALLDKDMRLYTDANLTKAFAMAATNKHPECASAIRDKASNRIMKSHLTELVIERMREPNPRGNHLLGTLILLEEAVPLLSDQDLETILNKGIGLGKSEFIANLPENMIRRISPMAWKAALKEASLLNKDLFSIMIRAYHPMIPKEVLDEMFSYLASINAKQELAVTLLECAKNRISDSTLDRAFFNAVITNKTKMLDAILHTESARISSETVGLCLITLMNSKSEEFALRLLIKEKSRIGKSFLLPAMNTAKQHGFENIKSELLKLI